MEVFLDRLSSGQIVAVISILVGGIVALAMIVAITKYQFQLLADDTAIKQEKQQSDLSLREKLINQREATGERTSVEELLALGVGENPAKGEVNSELAKKFGLLDASAEEIERTLGLALAADPARQKMIVDVIDELYEAGAESSVILAAVRPLCGTAAKARKHCQVEPASC